MTKEGGTRVGRREYECSDLSSEWMRMVMQVLGEPWVYYDGEPVQMQYLAYRWERNTEDIVYGLVMGRSDYINNPLFSVHVMIGRVDESRTIHRRDVNRVEIREADGEVVFKADLEKENAYVLTINKAGNFKEE